MGVQVACPVVRAFIGAGCCEDVPVTPRSMSAISTSGSVKGRSAERRSLSLRLLRLRPLVRYTNGEALALIAKRSGQSPRRFRLSSPGCRHHGSTEPGDDDHDVGCRRGVLHWLPAPPVAGRDVMRVPHVVRGSGVVKSTHGFGGVGRGTRSLFGGRCSVTLNSGLVKITV
jgi:hypothetical protein